MIDNEHPGEPPLRRVWSAIDETLHKMSLVEEKLKMVETVVDRQSNFALGEITRYDTLRKEISLTNEAIAELTEKVNQLAEAVASIRKAPLVVVGFMASLAAIGSTILAILKHLNAAEK